MQLLLAAVVLFLAIFAIKISSKSGIPALLLFIVLGMAFSAMGFEFEDYKFADNFATIALMVIMFQGGFSTNWSMAKPVAREAIILSFFGVVATAVLTGIFCRYFFGFGWVEGMLIGSIVGSTDYASVSNI
ncbi:MAG: potassium/proton antiporter, partial [Tissierellia bacterium]|nr:potassium/proton antiporter [Tissierellia bacterium]